MEPISIEGTPKTPTVKFDSIQGFMEIKGRSNPENSKVFYEPLIDWLEEYAKDPGDNTIVNIQLEHFNTSSSKCILDVFKILEAIYKAKHEVVIGISSVFCGILLNNIYIFIVWKDEKMYINILL